MFLFLFLFFKTAAYFSLNCVLYSKINIIFFLKYSLNTFLTSGFQTNKKYLSDEKFFKKHIISMSILQI